MALGIGLMVAMMVGMLAGGASYMHYGEQDKSHGQTAIEGKHDQDKTVGYPCRIIPTNEDTYEPGP